MDPDGCGGLNVEKIRLLLVDDQLLFLESLQTVIKTTAEDLEVVGIAANGQTAIDLALETKPDIILMDVRMPDISGVECTRIIKEHLPAVHIMMLTTFDDDEYVLQALSLGAVGYILKDVHTGYLINAIRSVHKGGVLIAPKVARKLVAKLNPAGEGQAASARQTILETLSSREQEVLQQIAKGYSNKEIAQNLFIAEQTVKNYVSVIYSKLGVHDRTQALRLAIEAGFSI
ncbi:MAG: response regulator transcription factor [Spirochaetales bacterium]|nr:response regulator transcription factor [Spirochaetales bacterium]